MTSGFKGFIARLASYTGIWWFGLIAWALILFLLSARSTLPPGPEIPYQDKVMHFLYFSGGGFCFSAARLGVLTPLPRRWRWWMLGTAFGIVIGALDEYHQTYTPGRSGNDVGDWLADLTGAGAGALLAWVLFSWLRRGEAAAQPTV
ncbi:VanZ like family protein [Prosthecobacter debontii]|uniref:VanZ like family protein n=1 Tax=Prosthecobacter debontii TaxID=48467 RepID=A0A1T4Y5F7_9BACT|nr:VanZ family protein [Prosthecobacter debontii]SKA97064.1 VanZ like family protein [Prosthecobacter debontii]